MTKKQISRRDFLKRMGQGTVAAALAGVLKVVPEVQDVFAQKTPAGKLPPDAAHSIVSPLSSGDPILIKLKAATTGYNPSVFDGDIDWQRAGLYRQTVSKDSTQDTVVLAPIQSASTEIFYLGAAVRDDNIARPIIVGYQDISRTDAESGKLNALMTVYQINGQRVGQLQIIDNQATEFVSTTSGKGRGLQRPMQDLCCDWAAYATCISAGVALCLVGCAGNPACFIACEAIVVAACTAEFCWVC